MLKFIEQLQAVAENPTNPLHGKIAWDNLGAAGHSRGAKIAAMHFAGGFCVVPLDTSSVTTAVLSLHTGSGLAASQPSAQPGC